MAAAGTKGDQSFARLPPIAKALILVLLVGLICGFYYFALHMSVSSDLSDAQRRENELEQSMHDAQARNTEYVRLREELSSREGLDRTNLRALPETAETASFLADLNGRAELCGLQIRLVEPRPEESEEHYVRLPVSLQLTGRYHQLARFFNGVSGLPRLISMENIHLNEPRLVGEEVLIDVDVLATTFRRPSEEDAAEAEAEGAEGS
jgi:type IV pilus assembly protein PilO